MRMRWIGRILVVLALAGVAGCSRSLGNNDVIDGWSIDTIGSPGCEEACPAYVDKAKAQFDLDVPGHPAVASAIVYAEGRYRRRDGDLLPVVRSGGPFTVVVLRLADGSLAALGVQPFGEGRLWALRRGPHPIDE